MQDLSHRLRATLRDHRGRTFTAAVLMVASGGEPPIELAMGEPDPEEDHTDVTIETPFDLASITKIFTASAVLRLVANGNLHLDDPVKRYVEEFRGAGKAGVTVRHLLTHTSGLPALVRLFGPDAAPGDPWTAILSCALQDEPGARVEYSDVGFLVLGRLIETVTGQELRKAMRHLVLEPLGTEGVRYAPCPAAPATEYDSWRERRIRGEVHDENCYVLGGASGHAGLFGRARDLLMLAQAYVNRGRRFLPPDLIAGARQEQARTEDERRGLGWKLRSPSPTASEHAFSAQTFGHYGFTGTALWIDPDRDLTVVLLTNRVYFGRDPVRIQLLRREVFLTLAKAIQP